MKKKIMLLIMLIFMPFISVNADTIYKISMEVDLQKDGSANIQEVWDVQANSGSEWYKQILDLKKSEVTNFTVLMDGHPLTQKEKWDVNGDILSKKGYYGIHKIQNGLELCFGKSDYNRHTFVLNYKISNYIFNTKDAQVLYATMFPRVRTQSFYVRVKSYYKFPKTLDVWGYGYRGYAYVKDGVIEMSEGEDLNDEYVVLLAKFPLGTFDTKYKTKFSTFNKVLEKANKGINEKYNGGNISFNFDKIFEILPDLIVLIFIFYFFLPRKEKDTLMVTFPNLQDGKLNKDIPNYREIPCNGNLLRTFFVANQYQMHIEKGNFLGAILLKWIKNKNIKLEKVSSKRMNGKEKIEYNIIFETLPNGPEEEQNLYNYMKDASKDNILEPGEFKKWFRKSPNIILDWYDKVLTTERQNLVDEGILIEEDIPRKEMININITKRYIADHKLKEEASQLMGLKKFLIEFSRIKEREPIEVELWAEYLMFAQMFGIAKKVAKRFEKLYPEIVEYMDASGCDLDSSSYVDDTSNSGVSYANKVRQNRSGAEFSARSYSSGGGGFSSGGGGGGSFGGGGGGSMGGR